VETQAGVCLTDADGRVDPDDSFDKAQSPASEVSRPRVVGSELILQTFPRNHGGFPEITHPVGEPNVEVDGEGRSLQLTDRSKVHRDGRTRYLIEEVLTQDDVRSPSWSPREELSQRPWTRISGHLRRARRSRGEAQRGLPFEPH